MKVMFYATDPLQPIGYGKIAHKISEFLASKSEITELTYLSVTSYKQTQIDRPVSPKIKFIDVSAEDTADPFGSHKILEYVERYTPDVLFIYNDIIVLTRLINALRPVLEAKKVLLWEFIDLVYPYEKPDFVFHMQKWCNHVFVMSEYWQNHLVRDYGFESHQVTLFRHGYDESMVRIDRSDARRILHLGQDDFIVLNANRNSYRKATDVSIRAFLLFLRKHNMNPNIKLFLHMQLVNGYDVYSVIKTECIRLRLDYNFVVHNSIVHMGAERGHHYKSDYLMNLIYCACDVGINTCMGEGLGLCQLEHAVLGNPQVVAASGGLNDIFPADNSISVVVPPVGFISCPQVLDTHEGDLLIYDAEAFADALDAYFVDPELRRRHGQLAREQLSVRYAWTPILTQFWNDFQFQYARAMQGQRISVEDTSMYHCKNMHIPRLYEKSDDNNGDGVAPPNDLPWPLNTVPIWCISIRKWRFDDLQRRMSVWGSDSRLVRFAGTNGKTDIDIDQWIAQGKLDPNQLQFSKGHMGCYDSHVRCWQKQVDENLPYVMILEDDVAWTYSHEHYNRLHEAVQELFAISAEEKEANVKNNNDDEIEKKEAEQKEAEQKEAKEESSTLVWDVAYFAGTGAIHEMVSDHWAVPRGCQCVIMYLVTLDGARKLLAHAWPIRQNVDMHMAKLRDDGVIEAVALHKPLCWTMPFGSDTEY